VFTAKTMPITVIKTKTAFASQLQKALTTSYKWHGVVIFCIGWHRGVERWRWLGLKSNRFPGEACVWFARVGSNAYCVNEWWSGEVVPRCSTGYWKFVTGCWNGESWFHAAWSIIKGFDFQWSFQWLFRISNISQNWTDGRFRLSRNTGVKRSAGSGGVLRSR